MTLDKEAVQKLEKMAKLDLMEKERAELAKRISFLSEQFDKILSVETNAEPLVSVVDLKNVLREDVAFQMVSKDEILQNAPAQNDGYFQVPKTMD